ncbi:hypothetical protein Plhal703r1_c61g0165761 [Plasmopara halstedii]
MHTIDHRPCEIPHQVAPKRIHYQIRPNRLIHHLKDISAKRNPMTPFFVRYFDGGKQQRRIILVDH